MSIGDIRWNILICLFDLYSTGLDAPVIVLCVVCAFRNEHNYILFGMNSQACNEAWLVSVYMVI